jgi:hypothetical protein
MYELERALAWLTPRVATVALLHFDAVVEQCERERGCALSPADRRTIRLVLLSILARECKP